MFPVHNLESLLMGLLPRAEEGEPLRTRVVSSNHPFMATLMGEGGGGTSSSSPGQRTDAGRGDSAVSGNIYTGGLPPALWIEREQQRSTAQLTATGGSNIDGTRLREEGNRFFKEDRLREAVQRYSQAIEVEPTSVYTWTNRSFAFYRLGEYAQSAADAEQAIRLQPDFFKAYYRLGLAQLALGDYSHALENLRRAYSNSPEAELDPIRVSIAKCESKIARTPNTPLLTSSAGGHASMATDCSTAPRATMTEQDFQRLDELLQRTSTFRAAVESYQQQHGKWAEFEAFSVRADEVRRLLNIATSNNLTEQVRVASEKQAVLRQSLKSHDQRVYTDAKRERDEAYRSMWRTATEVEHAIRQLNLMVAVELSARARMPPDWLAERESASSEATSTQNNEEGKDEVADVATLVNRRNIIDREVRRMADLFDATDRAAQRLRHALEEEEAEMARISPMLAEARGLGEALERHARSASQSTGEALLSERRVSAFDQLQQQVDHVRAEESLFQKTLAEGNRLLDDEARLERERLVMERQRIQLQAEIEWYKVNDEPDRRIVSLQERVKALQQRLATHIANQKAIQQRLVELVDQQHPDLAWKSILSGSRILRMIKGSGLWLNRSFSDYPVTSILSNTVNGKVYHCTDRGEHVALKEVAVDDDDVAKRRFQTEVQIVASCTHPNIIRVKGVFFDGPFGYLLMPFYHRGSIRTHMNKRESFATTELQDIFRQLMSGLAYIHEHGIVHGDIKPSNVLLTDDGRPMISDFGIAKKSISSLDAEDLTTTVTGITNAGTKNYMAPEQLLALEKNGATGMSDVWALGMTFFEIAATNAFLLDASLGAPELPSPQPGQVRVEIQPKRVGGDEKLADLIASLLATEPTRRMTPYEALGHPYFSSPAGATATLTPSDERLETVRSFIHAVRSGSHERVLVSVARDNMVNSMLQIFTKLSQEEMMRPIMVVFQGEAGIDEGALTTEMLNVFYDQLVRQSKALVRATEIDLTTDTSLFNANTTFLPASDSANVPMELFELLGKVLLKNIIENRSLPLQLSSAVLKYFCGMKASMLDYEEYDPVMAGTLKRLRLLSSADLSDADLDFSAIAPSVLETHNDGRYTAETKVTSENVQDYIALRVQYDLIECRSHALAAMKKGFHFVAALVNHLKLLSPSDLLLLLCGVQHVSAQAIIDVLEFVGFSTSSNTPKHLQEVLREMSQNDRRRFLQLCTSNAAVPVATSDNRRRIKIAKCADTQRLPVGHGCVNQLDLPDYNNKAVLQEKLSISLAHVSDGFHII